MTNNSGSNNSSSTAKTLLRVIPVVIIVIFFANVATRYVRSTVSTEIKTETPVQKKDKKQHLMLHEFTGDERKLWKEKFLKHKEHQVYVALNYEVETFPTSTSELGQLIPEKFIEKYKNRDEQQFVFIFTNPDFPNLKMRHQVKAKFNNAKLDTIVYDGFRNISKKDKITLTTKRRSTNDGILSGTITRYDATNSATIAKEKFKISFSNDDYERLKNENKLDTDVPYAKFQPYRITGLEDEHLKNVILNNISIVQNKKLKLGNYFTSKGVAYYTPSDDKSPITFSVKDIETAKGTLTFSHGSMDDDIGIFKLDGKQFQIRHFANKETKKIVGMHMVTKNASTNQIEVIETFYN